MWLSVRGHGGWRGTAVVKSKDAKLGAQMSEGRRRWRSRLKETERANSCVFCFFVLFLSSRIGWCPPTVIRADLLSLLVIQMLISSTNTLTDTPGNNVLPALWTTCSPVKLTHKSNHPSPLAHTCLKLGLSSEGGFTGYHGASGKDAWHFCFLHAPLSPGRPHCVERFDCGSYLN